MSVEVQGQDFEIIAMKAKIFDINVQIEQLAETRNRMIGELSQKLAQKQAGTAGPAA